MEPEQAAFAETGFESLCEEGGPAGAPAPLAVMDAQSQGHIPVPGKRNFPIDLPSKSVPTWGGQHRPLCQNV